VDDATRQAGEAHARCALGLRGGGGGREAIAQRQGRLHLGSRAVGQMAAVEAQLGNGALEKEGASMVTTEANTVERGRARRAARGLFDTVDVHGRSVAIEDGRVNVPRPH